MGAQHRGRKAVLDVCESSAHPLCGLAGRRSKSSMKTLAARQRAEPPAPVSNAWSPKFASARSVRWQLARYRVLHATVTTGSSLSRCAVSLIHCWSIRRPSMRPDRAMTGCSWG